MKEKIIIGLLFFLLFISGCGQSTQKDGIPVAPKQKGRPENFQPINYKYSLEDLKENFSGKMMQIAAKQHEIVHDVDNKESGSQHLNLLIAIRHQNGSKMPNLECLSIGDFGRLPGGRLNMKKKPCILIGMNSGWILIPPLLNIMKKTGARILRGMISFLCLQDRKSTRLNSSHANISY